MRIQNNMMALNTYRQYNIANNQTAGYAEKLSSGYQINRAGDDAAGLAISEKMRAQIRGLNMASKNSLDAVSLIQTAEGALQSTHDILQRMRELAVQAASDTNEQVIDRGALDQEFQALKAEIDDTARTTRFNDQNLIDGTFQKAFYSTDITYSKLTSQTVADVNRVGVKSNHNMDGTYNINVQYIKGQDAVYARASEVDTQVADADKKILLSSDTAGTSIINRVDFDAVVGAEHNGKTFTIRASGEGVDLFDDNDGLKVTMTDGDTVYTGEIVSTSRMDGGASVTINFNGVGTMTLYLDEDIEVTDQDVYNIASALNTKQIKFMQSPAVKTDADGNELSTGLGTTGAHGGGILYAYSATPTGGTVVTPGTFATVTGAGGTMNVTGTAAATLPVNNPAATDISVTGLSFNSVSITAALKGVATDAANTVTTTGTYKLQLNLGSDYGTYEIDVSLTAGATSAAVATAINTAISGFSLDVTATPTGQPAYYIETNFNFTDANSTGATRTDLEVTNGTVTAGAGGANDPILDFSGVEFTITLEDGLTQVVFSTTNANDWASGTGLLTVTEKYAPHGVEGELTYVFDLAGYGSFEMHIGAEEDRLIADLPAEAQAALENITLSLGDMAEGVDSVKKVDAQIALTLNGEVVMLSENDTKAAFDSSGVSLSFRPLDFANVKDTATATAQFTTSGSKDTISIKVIENEGKALTIQTGANQGDELDINIDAMNLQMLGLTDSSISTQKNASRAITEVNNAINQVSTQRAALGALQNRLNFKIANLDTSAENLQSAESRIRDTDMAKVMTAFTKSNILGQAATAMLAQANSQPQNVLQLLR